MSAFLAADVGLSVVASLPPLHFVVPVASVVPLSLSFLAFAFESASVTLPETPDVHLPLTFSRA